MPLTRPRSILTATCAAAAALAGCGDDACGTDGAAVDGLTLTITGEALHYEHLVASANNDCPDAFAPSGVVSLTVSGSQVGRTSILTFCIPRPDRLGDGAQTLGDQVQIVDLSAESSGCTAVDQPTPPPTGTATASGVCAQGVDPAGFALALDGTVTMRRTCGGSATIETARLSGTVAVSAAP